MEEGRRTKSEVRTLGTKVGRGDMGDWEGIWHMGRRRERAKRDKLAITSLHLWLQCNAELSFIR